jgi:hypothetical protein
MGLFHHDDRDGAGVGDESASFEVLGGDRMMRRYARDDFDMIVETTDPHEVRREADRGWLVLDVRNGLIRGLAPPIPARQPRARMPGGFSAVV